MKDKIIISIDARVFKELEELDAVCHNIIMNPGLTDEQHEQIVEGLKKTNTKLKNILQGE